MLENQSSSLEEVMFGHYLCKIEENTNQVKLKWVRTLIRISCLADRKSYVVIICANSCENLTKN